MVKRLFSPVTLCIMYGSKIEMGAYVELQILEKFWLFLQYSLVVKELIYTHIVGTAFWKRRAKALAKSLNGLGKILIFQYDLPSLIRLLLK